MGETVEEWKMLMGQEGTMGDQVVLQVAANFFQRQIVILPVFWSAAHLPSLGITLISPSSKSPPKTSSSRSALFLQYFSRAGSSPPIIKVSGQNLERTTWWRVCNDLW